MSQRSLVAYAALGTMACALLAFGVLWFARYVSPTIPAEYQNVGIEHAQLKSGGPITVRANVRLNVDVIQRCVVLSYLYVEYDGTHYLKLPAVKGRAGEAVTFDATLPLRMRTGPVTVLVRESYLCRGMAPALVLSPPLRANVGGPA